MTVSFLGTHSCIKVPYEKLQWYSFWRCWRSFSYITFIFVFPSNVRTLVRRQVSAPTWCSRRKAQWFLLCRGQSFRILLTLGTFLWQEMSFCYSLLLSFYTFVLLPFSLQSGLFLLHLGGPICLHTLPGCRLNLILKRFLHLQSSLFVLSHIHHLLQLNKQDWCSSSISMFG